MIGATKTAIIMKRGSGGFVHQYWVSQLPAGSIEVIFPIKFYFWKRLDQLHPFLHFLGYATRLGYLTTPTNYEIFAKWSFTALLFEFGSNRRTSVCHLDPGNPWNRWKFSRFFSPKKTFKGFLCKGFLAENRVFGAAGKKIGVFRRRRLEISF